MISRIKYFNRGSARAEIRKRVYLTIDGKNFVYDLLHSIEVRVYLAFTFGKRIGYQKV